MKQQRQSNNSGGQIELPPLKTWTKDSLTPRDWKFANFCESVERACSELPADVSNALVYRSFTWELDRELGSGNGPFDIAMELEAVRLNASRDANCQIVLRRPKQTEAITIPPRGWFLKPQQRRQPLNEWHLADLAQYVTPDTYGVSRGTNDICAMEIPWSDDEADVVDAFRLWLRRHRGVGGGKKTPKQRGRKHAWQPWFTSLAIYRLSLAGFDRARILERVGRMSNSSYKRTIPFITARIRQRYGNLVAQAEHYGKLRSELGDWRQHFLKQ